MLGGSETGIYRLFSQIIVAAASCEPEVSLWAAIMCVLQQEAPEWFFCFTIVKKWKGGYFVAWVSDTVQVLCS